MHEGIIIKRSSIVETLGSVTVICTDKTGTITENSMQLKHLYDYQSDTIYEEKDFTIKELDELIDYAMWSSEPVPFDPMEITLHKVYEQTQDSDTRKDYHLVHEYPLEGKPPMMTHLFENNKKTELLLLKELLKLFLMFLSFQKKKRIKYEKSLKNSENKDIGLLGSPNLILKETIFL